MKTTLTHNFIHQFERLVCRSVKAADLPQSVSFVPCSDGLQMVAVAKDAAVVTMTLHKYDVTSGFTLPWSAIKELALKKRDTFEIDVDADAVKVTYLLGDVPQHRVFTSQAQTDDLPTKPAKLTMHSLNVFDALVDGAKCVDPDNVRYSLGAICLRGAKSQIISTDGRQALIQGGFEFSWSGDVLCPTSKVFGAKELREQGEMVQVGAAGDWLYFEIGNVSLWLKQVEGKFPSLDRFTEDTDKLSWATIHLNDADFIAQRLENLPGKADEGAPVYVALNGHMVAIRGHDKDQQTATELRLTRSFCEGKPVTTPLNRRYLKNAFDFGVTRLGFDPDDKSAVICYGDRSTFIVMPLEGHEPTVDANNVVVLKSDANVAVQPVKSSAMKSVTVKSSAVQSCTTKSTTPKRVDVQTEPYSNTATNDVIADSEGLCQTLADTLRVTKRLVRDLKTQRKQNRLMRATIASLKQLQSC